MKNYAKIIVRSDFQKKDGTSPIYLRLTFDRKIKNISLKKSAHSNDWSEEQELLKASHPDADRTNMLLRSYAKRANDIIYEYDLKNKPLSFDTFENEFFGIKTDCYYSFVERELENNKNTKEYSAESHKSYSTEISKLKQFKKTLKFEDITIHFLESYEGYMRNKLGNKVNTIHKSLKTIRTFINKAIRKDLLSDNVFRKYKLKTEKSKREHLSVSELAEIESLLDKPILNYHKNTIKIFLFSCYTGLRYQDIKLLRYSDINNGIITIRMHKTKDIVTIPLIDRAKELIANQQRINDFVFKVPCNQTINRFLKEALKPTSIKKDITFHCSRHTFATYGITVGIPLEVISKLLGHNDIKTTLIYAKVVDTVKVMEMQKWNR